LFANNNYTIPQPHEDLDKYPHMQAFGKYNRKIGDPAPETRRVKSPRLSEDEKLEIEKQAERLH
jgi:hypothetical protein